jgi:hypothetical protein
MTPLEEFAADMRVGTESQKRLSQRTITEYVRVRKVDQDQPAPDALGRQGAERQAARWGFGGHGPLRDAGDERRDSAIISVLWS